MSTRVHFKDTRYRSGGRLSTISWAEVHRKLAAHGATQLGHNARPDFFIAGAGSRSKEGSAYALGIPIIHEAALITALDVGYFDYESRVIDHDLDANTVISELRPGFDGPPTSESWTRCLEFIERCPDEQLDPVLHYITQGISGWGERHVQWQPKHSHGLLTGVPKSWLHGCPTDELCVAPPIWIYEMTRPKKTYHPKHKLIRTLNLDEMRMSFNHYRRVLNNPHLTNLRILNMGVRSNCSQAVFKSLTTLSAITHVEEIWLHGNVLRELEEGLDRKAVGAFKSLKRIRVFSRWMEDQTAQRLRQHPCFSTIITISKAAPY